VSTYARAAARRPGIRWDRVGRVFLLGVLFAIMLLYVSPLQRWLTQRGTARQDSAQLHELQAHNADLKAKLKALQQPQALQMRARQLGMVGRGERAFVIENLPR
jgi:cell division protein FtsB